MAVAHFAGSIVLGRSHSGVASLRRGLTVSTRRARPITAVFTGAIFRPLVQSRRRRSQFGVEAFGPKIY
jgi:hypothetical protein